ncbi:hypothetical protein Hanom_Chr12g01122211 [Helianthus anomalus]
MMRFQTSRAFGNTHRAYRKLRVHNHNHNHIYVCYSSRRLLLHQAMAMTYRKMLPVVPPPTVQRNLRIPISFSSSVASLNSSIVMFMPNTPATTTKALTTRVAVVNMTPICRR